MDNLEFQKAEETDLDSVLDIYNFYIEATTATFDIGPISKEEFRQRIFMGHEKYQTYLIKYSAELAGFCFLTQFRKKKAYDRTAEIGIYLRPGFIGKGIGGKAVTFLETIAANKQIRVIVASVSGENLTSIKMFERLIYERCAHYKEVGEKFGRLVDVIDLQKILKV